MNQTYISIIINKITVETKEIHGGHKKTMCRLTDAMVPFKKAVRTQQRKTKKYLRKRKINTIIMIKWDMDMVTIIITIITTKVAKRKDM